MRALLPVLLVATATANAAPASIKVNQLAFAPAASKLAVVADTGAASFEVIDATSGKRVLRGSIGPAALWQPSMETVRLADFSALRTPGRYRIRIAGAAMSDCTSACVRAVLQTRTSSSEAFK